MAEPIAGVGYLAGLCGHTGTAWQKQGMLWGYHDQWDENLGGISDVANYKKGTSAIPANEVWVLQGISVRNNTRTITNCTVYLMLSTGALVVMGDLRPAPRYQPCFATGQFVMRTGDVAWVEATGGGSGDDIQAGVVGYKMRLDL